MKKKNKKKRKKAIKCVYKGMRLALFIIILLYNLFDITYPEKFSEQCSKEFGMEEIMESTEDSEYYYGDIWYRLNHRL